MIVENPTFMVVDDDDIDAQSIERALKKILSYQAQL
jgi:ABC-type branched-subunit amino acid transport system substrate-binding protein